MILQGTHDAVCTFARIEIEALSRKAIRRLQRIVSSGIFGDAYIHKTLWDEYCHEVQEGPHDTLEEAWELAIDTVIDDVLGEIPRHSAVLLTIYAAWEADEDDAASMVGSVWPDGIKSLIKDCLGGESGGAKPPSPRPVEEFLMRLLGDNARQLKFKAESTGFED